ncbi:MAG: hypothetical protein AAGK37_19160, partial [Pseudomonadota bacterium]
QGREVFEATLNDPDAFDVSLFSTHFEGALPLMDTSLLAYEARTGKPMTRKYFTVENHLNAQLPEDDFADLLPGLAARLGVN